eukprot:m.177806 g.177806  ORF g.177806 m.177806 type:complete len:358 (-) comp31911_c0_seq1:421-1494(-)
MHVFYVVTLFTGIILQSQVQGTAAEPGTQCAGNVVIMGRRATGVTGNYKVEKQTWGGQRMYSNGGLFLYYIVSEQTWFISRTYGVKDLRIQSKWNGKDLFAKGQTWLTASGGSLNHDPSLKVECDDGSSRYAAIDAPAQAVYIFGRSPHKHNANNINGVYMYTDRISVGQPVYKKGSDQFLSLNEVNQWILSSESDIGSQRASAFYDAPNGNKEPVYDITGMVWQISGRHGNWEKDTETKLVRGFGRPIVISGRKQGTFNDCINGKYVASNVIQNNRIIYEREQSETTVGEKTFIYYHGEESQDKKWIISHKTELGTGNGIAWVQDDYGDEPESTSWHIAGDTEVFTMDPYVRASVA